MQFYAKHVKGITTLQQQQSLKTNKTIKFFSMKRMTKQALVCKTKTKYLNSSKSNYAKIYKKKQIMQKDAQKCQSKKYARVFKSLSNFAKECQQILSDVNVTIKAYIKI